MSARAHLRLRSSLLLLVAPLLLAPLSGCGGRSGSDASSPSAAAPTTAAPPIPTELTASQADLGDQWPLTVSPVTLHCEVDGAYQYVTFDYDGTTYAFNGSARQVADEHGWTDWQPDLWADNPNYAGVKVVPNDLIARGVSLCGTS